MIGMLLSYAGIDCCVAIFLQVGSFTAARAMQINQLLARLCHDQAMRAAGGAAGDISVPLTEAANALRDAGILISMDALKAHVEALDALTMASRNQAEGVPPIAYDETNNTIFEIA